MEQVVLNDITRYGLRRVHVMGEREIEDVDGWIERFVSEEARELVTIWRSQERELGIWHLWLCWNAREVMQFQNNLVGFGCGISNPNEIWDFHPQLGVLWWMGHNAVSVRWQAEMAATMFRLKTGERPGRVWVREKPKTAGKDTCPTKFEVGLVGEERVELEMEVKEWVPKGFLVVVGGEG